MRCLTLEIIVVRLLASILTPTTSAAWTSTKIDSHQRSKLTLLSVASVNSSSQSKNKQQLGSFDPLYEFRDPNLRRSRRVIMRDWVMDSTDGGSDTSHLVSFEDAWSVQKQLWQHQSARILSADGKSSFLESSAVSGILSDEEPTNALLLSSGVDQVIFLEHAAVYTLGTGSDPSYIRDSAADSNVPVVRMDRGGEVTYHGPGQLTVYPVVDLRSYKQDIHWYMRALEECILLALKACGVKDAYRDEETTGVWVRGHKVAAIGIKCRKWVTQHGLAVNVEASALQGFGDIVPCGLEGRRVGYVNQFLDFDKGPLTVRQFSEYMKEAVEAVFRIELARNKEFNKK